MYVYLYIIPIILIIYIIYIYNSYYIYIIRKNFSKNIFIFKILVLGLTENYWYLPIGCTKNSGYESLAKRDYDFGQVMKLTERTFNSQSSASTWHTHPGGWREAI